MGKSTEDTTMELDREGADYKQLKDLIHKECDKRDHRYAQLEDKYNKLEQHITHTDHQKTWQRGANNQQTTEPAPQKKSDLKHPLNQ